LGQPRRANAPGLGSLLENQLVKKENRGQAMNGRNRVDNRKIGEIVTTSQADEREAAGIRT
jgi:hypothetical protein